jgi:hypothetical protein
MKNSAKRARAEEFTINTKTTFKNRLYTNLDIHEEKRARAEAVNNKYKDDFQKSSLH